jgi:hypothetical protein
VPPIGSHPALFRALAAHDIAPMPCAPVCKLAILAPRRHQHLSFLSASKPRHERELYYNSSKIFWLQLNRLFMLDFNRKLRI